MQRVAAPENLLAAWHAVRGNIPRVRRERSAGPDGVTLIDFERELPAQLSALRHALLRGSYRAQPPAIASLPKKDGGARKIAVLNVSDRVAQRAVQQVLEPIFEPLFLPCSFGFRPGLSTGHALERARQARLAGNGWVVDGDINACFDSLDHTFLLRRIELRVKDTAVLALLQQWVSVGIIENCPPRLPRRALAERARQAGQQARRVVDLAGDPRERDRWQPPDDPWPGSDSITPERFDPLDDYGRNHDWGDARAGDDLRQSALHGLLASGAALGAGWVRPALARLGSGVLSTLQTTAGRELLRRGALAGGGFVGAVVGVGAAAYLLYRKAAPTTHGVLQGSPLSPLLANIYLHAFDMAMSRSGLELVRFADDWVVLSPTQVAADRAYNQAFITLKKIRLELNPQKTRVYAPDEDVRWLGGSIPATGRRRM